MIKKKTSEEIAIMATGGKMLAATLWKVMAAIKPGVSELDLDHLAETLILEKGGEPGFQKVPGYKHTICVSTNDVVVHGIPTAYKIKEGDVIGIDCGVYFKGFHTDMAETLRVSTINKQQLTNNNKDEIDTFLETGKRALDEAIAVAKAGNRVGHISKVIQDIVEKQGGYSIVRTLVGHGVGKNLHEEPEVPGFERGDIAKTPQLVAGMVIAIEIIYNMGKRGVVYKNDDGWTISTQDESMSGLFERTVAITKENPIVLTA